MYLTVSGIISKVNSIKKLQLFLCAALGNTLEIYEFALFAYFAPLFAQVFFPEKTQFMGLMTTYGLFAAGFLSRPFGAILFGYLGDRFGRKKTLSLSILLMATPTTLMGCLPTYAQIGAWAVLPLLLCRLTQGLAMSGEFIGAIIYISEHAPVQRRGWYGSWVLVGTLLGFLLGSVTVTALTAALSPADLQAWGWRLPFLFAAVLGALGLYLRLRMPETPIFAALQHRDQTVKRPLREALRQAAKPMARIFCLNTLSSITYYFLLNYLSAYLTLYAKVPLHTALLLNTLSTAALLMIAPAIAAWSDRIGRKPILLTAIVGFMIGSYPLFLLLQQGNMLALLLGQLGFTVLVGSIFALVPSVLVELVPATVRYTAIAVPFNLANALFGGTLPLMATFLIEKTGSPLAPSFCLIVPAIVAFLALVGMAESKGRQV